MNSPTAFLRVKTGSAPKTGLHAKGSITYAIIKDADDVYICLLANDAGGYFSREAVPFAAVERCLEGLAADQPLLAKIFKPAFVSRSANNAGFITAALRAEGLLMPAPEATHQHRLGKDWSEWRQTMLAATGEAFELPGATTPAEAPQSAAITNTEESAGPDAGKGRKPRKAPKADRESPSGTGEEGENASHP